MPPFPWPGRVLEDGVVALRAWRAEDAPVKAAWSRDPELVRWTGIPARYTEQEAQERTLWVESARRAGRGVWLAITEASTAVVLGSCDLRRPDSDDPALGEVGYALDPAARGRGYTTRAVRLLLDWGFDGLDMRRIQALVHPDNARSARVLERLDFRPEGLLREYRSYPPGEGDRIMYALLAGQRRSTGG
jgi:RimJ/RimL family protein N-acetyltransferase